MPKPQIGRCNGKKYKGVEQMKKVLITGASRGIGMCLSNIFAANDYLVFANHNKTNILSETKNIIPIKTDVSDPCDVADMHREIGSVDILINNAGIALQKLFLDTTQNEWDELFGVNVTGIYNCTKAFLPDMMEKSSGQIINISSIWGEIGGSCEVAYSATKAAILGFTKALSKEISESGVCINAVVLGAVDTDMHKKMAKDYEAMTGFAFSDNTETISPKIAAEKIYSMLSAKNGDIIRINC